MTPTAAPRSRRAGVGSRRPSGTGRRRPRRSARRAARRRRHLVGGLALMAAGGVVAAGFGLGPLGDAVREVRLPLQHEDIIRQQARDKDLDPALIAAVIYEETRFAPRTSPAGAEGLMQITPQTARFIAKRSGATTFTIQDLGDPQINISYGAFYLRYLLDVYDGDERLAVAAYNAGGTNVNRWLAAADDDDLDLDQIPFEETREYVAEVEERRAEYEKNYAPELGL